MEINSRRLGKTKQLMDAIEAEYFEKGEVIGPYTVWHPLPYDGFRIKYPYWYYNDDPNYVPIELALSNPELYEHLIDLNKKRFDEMWDMVRGKLKPGADIIGKAFITSTVDTDSDSGSFTDIWKSSDPEAKNPHVNGLYRYFTPAINAHTDEWGSIINDKTHNNED